MGNCLEMPKLPENNVQQTASLHQQTTLNNFRRSAPIVLPVNNFTARQDDIEQTEVKETALYEEQMTTLEVEPLKLDSSFFSASASQYSATSRRTGPGSYIKRYRNEEEKLLDMLQERERLLNSAIKQGQQLRAKCTRYKEELDNIKENTNVNENQWKKRYYEMDRKYRDIKEEVDVMVARNRNGRDYLRQQQETIDSLNLELQREKIERQRILSSSLTSLQSAGIGTKRKGKLLLTQLQTDNALLLNRVQELTQRNTRGRDYLSKLEAEKREQDALIRQLKQQVLHEKNEKENLLSKFGTAVRSSESRYSENWRQSQNSVQDLYATVQKKRAGPTTSNAHNTDDEKSTGFEINDSIHPIEMERNYHVLSGEYNEVEILPLSSENIKPKQTSSESESTDGKSINELNAEAIIEQINVEAEPTPRDISSFRHSENPYETVKEEENGIPNELINHEENYTKF